MNLLGLVERLKRVEKAVAERVPAAAAARGVNPAGYPADPVGYARDVLKVTLTPDQQAILKALLVPPFRVLVPSAHDVGKTFVAAVAVNWWYDSFDPGVVITTAPTERDVVDLLWTEVRLQRQRAGLPCHFIGPRAPEMRTAEEHYAKGYTARVGESFQGRHRRRMLFIFDEANGVAPLYWHTLNTMFDPADGHAVLCIFNPTDTTSQAYQEDSAIDLADVPKWHRFRLSALTHPNVLAELAGRPKPVPGAVGVAMIDQWVQDWCEPVGAPDALATDVEWRPGSGRWFRPGPMFQARALGLWPDIGAGVWSDSLWAACFGPEPPLPPDVLPVIGCDTATGKGEDFHAIHGRYDCVSLYHETANTMDPVRIFDQLKGVAALLATFAARLRPASARPVDPRQVPIQLDDDGTGGALCKFLLRDGYAASAIGAGTASDHPHLYPSKRSQLWFGAAERAKLGRLRLGRLGKAAQRRIKQQLMAPAWQLDGAGRRVVEKKDDTKDKIGRSPDDADALNLAYYEPPGLGVGLVEAQGRPRDYDAWNRRHRE